MTPFGSTSGGSARTPDVFSSAAMPGEKDTFFPGGTRLVEPKTPSVRGFHESCEGIWEKRRNHAGTLFPKPEYCVWPYSAIVPPCPTHSCAATDGTKGWYMIYKDTLKLTGSTIRCSTVPTLVQCVSSERSRAQVTVPYMTGRSATQRTVPTSLRPPQLCHHSRRTPRGA